MAVIFGNILIGEKGDMLVFYRGNFKKFRNFRKEDCLTKFEALWSLAKFESGVKFQATLS